MPDVSRVLSSVNSVLSLSLILAQTPTPAQAMRLVTTAVPSIAPSHSAVTWHPSRSGDYYERAPENVGSLALVDPARAATETDLAALQHAATELSVEVARLHSVSEAELRGKADREREVAETRAAVLAVSEARQRAILTGSAGRVPGRRPAASSG